MISLRHWELSLSSVLDVYKGGIMTKTGSGSKTKQIFIDCNDIPSVMITYKEKRTVVNLSKIFTFWIFGRAITILIGK